MTTNAPKDIEEYIGSFTPDIQKILEQIRATIKLAAPESEEKISYAIPTFVLNGVLVHFAAFKNHIGFYALPSGTKAFQKELSIYKSGKGSVQFPINKPMPLKLIFKMVQFRVKENLARSNSKKNPFA